MRRWTTGSEEVFAGVCRLGQLVLRPSFQELIDVCSQDELKTLNSYAINGTTRLTPIQKLIEACDLQQTWISRSWCHLRYTSSFKSKYAFLTLRGPVSSQFSVSALHLPHWSIPRSLPFLVLDFAIYLYRLTTAPRT